MHQDIETSTAQRLAQRAIAIEHARFIDDDELDIGDMAEQFGFHAPDDPGEASVRPGALQRSHDR